jgi:uncharacterized protein YjdB
MLRTKLLVVLATVLILLASGIGLAQAQNPPLPAIYSGSVQDTSGAVVASGIVHAYINDQLKGSEGFQGGKYYNIIVQGKSEDSGQPVVFKVVVNDVEYPATPNQQVKWNSGDMTGINYPYVNLTVDMSQAGQISVEAPTASPPSGSYTNSVTITLSCVTSGAKIYYTTDGSDPVNSSSRIEYVSPFTLRSSATVRAMATKSGVDSPVKSFGYAVTSPSSGGGSGSTTQTSVQVSVYPSTLALNIGQTQALQVTTNPAGASSTYTSSNTGVATVDAAGLVTAVGKGTATITVSSTKSGYIQGTAYVQVSVADSSNPPDTTTPGGGGSVTGEYSDLTGHWAQNTIMEMAARGIISGYPDKTFRPDNSITRAECASIMARALNLEVDTTTALDSFSDAADIPQWAKKSLAAVVNEGLLKGYPGDDGGIVLSAQNNITRQELAVIISRIITQKLGEQTKAELTFADNDKIAAWAQEDIKVAIAKGIVKGYEDNTFQAANNVTRAECAAMISRLLLLL